VESGKDQNVSEDNLTAAMHGHWVNVMDPETARVMDKGIGSFTWESICNEDTPFCHHSLRRSFVCAGKPRRAFARVAARSLYKLHVNALRLH